MEREPRQRQRALGKPDKGGRRQRLRLFGVVGLCFGVQN